MQLCLDERVFPPFYSCRGPRALALLVVAALSAIMCVGIFELIEDFRDSRTLPPAAEPGLSGLRRLLES